MTSAAPLRGPPALDWAWAGRALQAESGDHHVVVQFDGGALVALLDGLGHGPEAAAAAHAAAPTLTAHARENVAELVRRCHDALRGTRGAAMSVASFDVHCSTMTWTSVGNVDALLFRLQPQERRRTEAICMRGGVVGLRLPPLRADTLPVARGDTLVMATDGIHSQFAAGVAIDDSPQEIAESILVRYGKDSDDASVVVARYLGASA